MTKPAFFIASTGQHVGKTTTCLGLLSGLLKRYTKVGFIKPIGQEHVEVEKGIHVDKDVHVIKDFFCLPYAFKDMSPVLFPRGFTRSYLDGKIHEKDLRDIILQSYRRIDQGADAFIVEGTGHIGVGSIVNLNNAEVAKTLGVPIILIASGGLGSSFDALSLNLALCEKIGVKVAGVILNRVLPEKRTMILSYMKKALSRLNLPIIGCIPFDPFLSNPSMQDFELLFGTTLLSGEEHRMRHFRHTRLAATALKNYREFLIPSQLVITPANREDIILATLTKHWDVKIENPRDDLHAGLILTGSTPPRDEIVEELKKANIPMLYVPYPGYKAMKMITSYTVKIRHEDKEKIKEAIEVVEKNIDFDLLCSIT